MTDSWFSPDGIAAACAVAGLGGGILIGYLRIIDSIQEKEIARLNDAVKANWKDLEKFQLQCSQHHDNDKEAIMRMDIAASKSYALRVEVVALETKLSEAMLRIEKKLDGLIQRGA